MNPVLRNSAAHLFVGSLSSPELSDDDAHHLFRVLRVRDGESVTLSDGVGGWAPFVVEGNGLAPAGEIERTPAPRECVVAVAIPKGDRVEWMVQKLTEVGASRIVFVQFARSVVRWDGQRHDRQLARLRRIATEAACQSRRTWLPQLDGPVPVGEAVRIRGLVRLDPAGQRTWGEYTAVLIGPEGGFDDREAAIDLPSVSLGATILRVETAAVVAAARILT